VLTPYRRHTAACPFRPKGAHYTLCDCPIWCNGMLNGSRYRHSLQTADMARAQRRIEHLERGDEAEPVAAAPARTVAEAVKVYLADASRRKLQPSTLKSYEATFKPLLKNLGKLALPALTIDRLRLYQEARKIKPRTERKEVEHLRAFGAFCIDRGWLSVNPAKKLKPPLAADVATMPFSAEEIRKLLTACDAMRGMRDTESPAIRRRARALILTLLYSGLRISDVAKLKRSALDPATGHLTLRTMKTGVPLKVLLHPDALQALGKLPSYRNPAHYFWSGNGGLRAATGSLRRTVERIGKLAGIHAHPHRFRDTFAVELLTNGADIRTVQMLLGHESVRTTEKHYAHFVAAHQALLDTAAATLDFQPKRGRLLQVNPLQRRGRNPK
jgi:site-specific recombinase XerD